MGLQAKIWRTLRIIQENKRKGHFPHCKGKFLCRCSLFRRKLHRIHAPCSGRKGGKQSSSLWVCSVRILPPARPESIRRRRRAQWQGQREPFSLCRLTTAPPPTQSALSPPCFFLSHFSPHQLYFGVT